MPSSPDKNSRDEMLIEMAEEHWLNTDGEGSDDDFTSYQLKDAYLAGCRAADSIPSPAVLQLVEALEAITRSEGRLQLGAAKATALNALQNFKNRGEK